MQYAAGLGPIGISVGDFNGDGKLDLAAGSFEYSSLVAVLLGNGDGTFQSFTTAPAGGDPFYMAMADFNGDGKLDLATSNPNAVGILLGNRDGTFHRPSPTMPVITPGES